MIYHPKVGILLALGLMAGWAQAEVVPMNDGELGAAVAQAGVAVDYELRWNMDASGNPLTASPYNSCTGSNNGCRLAWQANNRPNEWVIYKDFYMLVKLYNVRLDAVALPTTSTPYADSTRFQDSSGACLVVGCNPNGLTALQLGFAGDAGTHGEVDYEILMNTRLSMETTFSADTNTGYNRFRVADIGSDGVYDPNEMTPAKIDMDGRVMIYGF